MELLGFVGEGLHEAGVPYFAHEEVVEVAGRVLGVELERARSGSSTSVNLFQQVHGRRMSCRNTHSIWEHEGEMDTNVVEDRNDEILSSWRGRIPKWLALTSWTVE